MNEAEKRQLMLDTFQRLMDLMFGETNPTPGDTGIPGNGGSLQPGSSGHNGSANGSGTLSGPGDTIHIIGLEGGEAGLANNGSIAGRVLDAAGQPVAGISVAISASSQLHNDIAALTNAQGRFRLSNLAEGTYTLAAHGPNNAEGAAQVAVNGGQQTEIEVRLNG